MKQKTYLRALYRKVYLKGKTGFTSRKGTRKNPREKQRMAHTEG